MKILQISNSFPYPPDSGEKIRVYNVLKNLSINNDVDLICFARPENTTYRRTIENITGELKLILIEKRDKFRLGLDLIKTVSLGNPLMCTVYDSSSMYQMIEQYLRSHSPDLVQVEHSYMGHYVQFIKKISPATKCILVAHNIMYDYLTRVIPLINNPKKKLLGYIDWFILKRWESDVFRLCEAVIVMSERDRQWVEEHKWTRNCIVVPNGVDTENIAMLTETEKDLNILFVGSMHYVPNQDAVAYFANDILPRLEKKYPSITFTIVGSNAPPSLLSIAEINKRVKFVGPVVDLKAYYNAATVVVVPLRAGGGTRLKILEAMAYGRPVVSTTMGAEGLGITSGKEIMIADSTSEFSQSLDKILSERELNRGMVLQARAFVEAKYNWRSIVRTYEQNLREIVNLKTKDAGAVEA